MLTRRGGSVLGAAIGLYAGGRIVGLGQLDTLAAMAATLLAVAALWASRQRVDLTVERTVPERLTVGAEGRVDLTVRAGAHRLPPLLVTDQFDGGRRSARLRTPPLRPAEQARAAYRVPTERRGRFLLGPLRVSVTDPFGLVQRAVGRGPTDEVLVYPRVHELAPVPETVGSDLDPDTAPLRRRPDAGTEFLTLREYQVGDDLRRVHWRSTARRDELTIRQDESRRRAPVLVVLDVRPAAHSFASFERAVEAAASILAVLDRTGRDCELVASSGERLGTPGRRHLVSVLDELAVVEPHGADRMNPTVLRRRASMVIAVVGRLASNEHATLCAMPATGGRLVVVDTTGSARGAPQAAPRVRRLVVDASTDGGFPHSWNQTILAWQGPPTHPAPRSLSPA
jgi:uncharacterized protein (DUF58 family)